jgi:hypothetical protein
MIPPGYITLPEALDLIQACIDDDDLNVLQCPPDTRARRWAAIRGLGDEVSDPVSCVDLYVMKGGKPSQIPIKDARGLVSEGWGIWIEGGRVDVEAFANVPDDEFYSTETTERYQGCQLLVEDSAVRYYWKQQARLEPAKTGAPGRPSSMDLVMGEFARRIASHETAPSRSEESKELAKWLSEKHPGMPKCGGKRIFNKLPPSFQPRNERK